MGGLTFLLRVVSDRLSRRPGGPSVLPDPLEPRALLAATLSPDGVVLITGTDAADAFVVRLNAAGTDLQVQGDGIALFRLSAVQSVRVQGGGGDDTLTLDTGAGLLARADAPLPIDFDGGAGNDALVLAGAPAGGGVDETITPGPGAGEGAVQSRGNQVTQTVRFAGVESFLDTSTAATLTVNLNDGANLVEMVNGPAAGGVATGIIRAIDVTPVGTPAPVVPVPATPSTPPTTPPAGGAAAVPNGNSRRKGNGNAKANSKQERALAKAARKAANAAARAAARAARAARSGRPAAAALAAAAPVPQQSLLLGVKYVPVQFANKARITINTAGGDDWVAVDHAAAAAGLKALTVNAGDGRDHLAEVARPAGVPCVKEAVEDVTAARGFVTVTKVPATPVPPPPTPPPPTPTPPPTTPTPPSPTPDSGSGDDDGDNKGASGNDGKSDGKGESDDGKKADDTKGKDKKADDEDDDDEDDDRDGGDHDDDDHDD